MRRAAAGLFAGVAGTAAEALLSRAERALLGPAPYEPGEMARRLASKLDVDLGGRAAAVGSALRWTYGPGWGLAGSVLVDRIGRARGAAVLGLALYAFEITSLPLTGATPPVSAWSRRFLLADALNCCVYAAVTARLYGRLRPD